MVEKKKKKCQLLQTRRLVSHSLRVLLHSHHHSPPFLRTPPRASTLLPSFLRIAAAHGRSHVLSVPNVQQYPASAAAAAATTATPAATTTATTTATPAAAATATAATTTAGSGPGSAAPGDPSKHASVRHRPGQGMADAANAAAIQTTTVQ